MAKPSHYTNLYLTDEYGVVHTVKIYQHKLKSGLQYSFSADESIFRTRNRYGVADKIEDVIGIRSAMYVGNDEKIIFILSPQQILDKDLADRLTNRIERSIFPSKFSVPTQQTTSTPSTTPITSTNIKIIAINEQDRLILGMISTTDIINKTLYTQSDKNYLIKVFVDSQYPYFYTLIDAFSGNSETQIEMIRENIMNYVYDFGNSYSSDVAQTLATTLINYYIIDVVNNISEIQKISQRFDNNISAQDNPPKSLFIRKSDNCYVQSIDVQNVNEALCNYNLVFSNGYNRISKRTDFIVNGDTFQVLNNGVAFRLCQIKNDRQVILLRSEGQKFEFIKSYFDTLTSISTTFDIISFTRLQDYFTKKSANVTPTTIPTQIVSTPNKVNAYQANVEKINKEIAQLITIKNLTPKFKIETIINIEQKVAKKQKEVNDLAVVIVDNQLESNKIFDELFEQSFLPLKSRYDDIILSDTFNESGNFFTPNGQPSKLSDELNILIRTPQFINWFGDWQLAFQYKDIPNSGIDCSKVLTSDFEPKLVWHGTSQEFSYFKFDNFPASYYAVNRKYCDFFATIRTNDDDGGFVIPFFLNLRKPLDLTRFATRDISSKDFFDYIYLLTGMSMEYLEVNPIFLDPNIQSLQTWVYLRNNPKMIKKLAELNIFDGIHFYETNPNVPTNELGHRTEAYITFKPESSKIADPNRGNLIFASMKSFLLKKGGKI
jgi:hypothetical protein